MIIFKWNRPITLWTNNLLGKMLFNPDFFLFRVIFLYLLYALSEKFHFLLRIQFFLRVNNKFKVR